jgi:hypothetical protein
VIRCNEAFDTLARRIFSKSLKPTGWWTRVKTAMKCWMSDGAYDPLIFEAFLKDTFGVSRRMFDAFQGVPSATRVAVTAASISDSRPFLFSNYNGPTARKKDCSKSDDFIGMSCN